MGWSWTVTLSRLSVKLVDKGRHWKVEFAHVMKTKGKHCACKQTHPYTKISDDQSNWLLKITQFHGKVKGSSFNLTIYRNLFTSGSPSTNFQKLSKTGFLGIQPHFSQNRNVIENFSCQIWSQRVKNYEEWWFLILKQPEKSKKCRLVLLLHARIKWSQGVDLIFNVAGDGYKSQRIVIFFTFTYTFIHIYRFINTNRDE